MANPASSYSPRLVHYGNNLDPLQESSTSCWGRCKKKKEEEKKSPVISVKPSPKGHHERELTQFSIDYERILREERLAQKKKEKQ